MRILCARNGGTFVGLQEPRGRGGVRIGQAEKQEQAGMSPT